MYTYKYLCIYVFIVLLRSLGIECIMKEIFTIFVVFFCSLCDIKVIKLNSLVMIFLANYTNK